MKQAKVKSNPTSKSVYFNLENGLEKKMFDHVQGDYVRNFSSYVKGLIIEDMKRTGGVVNPYESANTPMPQINERPIASVPVEVPRRSAARVEEEFVKEEKVDVVKVEEEDEDPFGLPEEEESKDARAGLAEGFVNQFRKK